MTAHMNRPDAPPVVSIVGRKNSGKTTMVVALAAELKRRGHRVATVKHGHPHFEVDRPGSDSWRHYHEGGADAVLLASSARLVLIERQDDEPDPRAMIERFFAGRGYDLVLVEGYKRGPFPKIEIFRAAAGHDRPVYPADDAERAATFLAVVTDDASLDVRCERIMLAASGARVPAHVVRVAELIEARVGRAPA